MPETEWIARDADRVAFLQWAAPRLGLRWSGFRKVRRQVCKRVARRARELGLGGFAAYRARLERDPSEWTALDAACRVTISRFHRDRRVFEQLRADVLPVLARAARERGTALACWSAGCASGEEPYTLAILHRYGLAEPDRATPITIVATDADPRVLARARAARYARATLRELPEAWIDLAFARVDGELELREELRASVDFRCEDLRVSMPEGPFDLVLCRNLVLTYFDEARQREVALRMVERMVPGAALVVGSHEEPPPDVGLEPWPGVRSVYRRR
ncbi:MAG: chemotaxis protein CheR [Sandaracinaceae bacterium]|nr:chemotaxis protein CheR [Sandaracinaceae bacterium]